MKQRILLLAVALLLVLPIGVVLADTHGPSSQQGEQSNTQGSQDGMWECNMFGKFSYKNEVVTGRFVEFEVDEITGMITNYTVNREATSQKIFEYVKVRHFSAISAPKVEGAMFQLRDTGGHIVSHNNPPAVLVHTSTKQTNTIEYILASGFTATELDGGVQIDGNELSALVLIYNGTVTVNGSEILVSLGTDAHSVFRAEPEGMVSSQNQERIEQAIKEGRIGAELSLGANNGEYMYDNASYQYGMRIRVHSAQRNRLEIMVQAEFQEGKVVILNIDKGAIQASKPEDVVVKLDGKKVRQRNTIEEVLAAQGTDSEYQISMGEKGFQAFVYIPHFSEHMITIEPAESEPSMLLPLVVGAMIGTLAAVGIAYFHRRK